MMLVREDLIAALEIVQKQDTSLAERLRTHFKNEIEGTVVLKNGHELPMSYVTAVKEAWDKERGRHGNNPGWNPSRVSAIKKLREYTGFALREACEAVDEMHARNIL
jgi:hypothetical protein